MKYNELVKLLKSNGCSFYRNGANHEIWVNKKGQKFPIGRHGTQEVAEGTLRKILKQAGIK